MIELVGKGFFFTIIVGIFIWEKLSQGKALQHQGEILQQLLTESRLQTEVQKNFKGSYDAQLRTLNKISNELESQGKSIDKIDSRTERTLNCISKNKNVDH